MQNGQQQLGGLWLIQPVDGLIQEIGEVFLLGFELLFYLGQLGLPDFELGFGDGIFLVIITRLDASLVRILPVGWGGGLELTIQLGLSRFQLGQFGNEIAEQELH
ncbi:hypothetical protein D9M71_799640 [compost metagenome]